MKWTRQTHTRGTILGYLCSFWGACCLEFLLLTFKVSLAYSLDVLSWLLISFHVTSFQFLPCPFISLVCDFVFFDFLCVFKCSHGKSSSPMPVHCSCSPAFTFCFRYLIYCFCPYSFILPFHIFSFSLFSWFCSLPAGSLSSQLCFVPLLTLQFLST